MAILDLTGTQLLGLGFVALGFLVVALSARYVWRATGLWRASRIEAIEDATPGSLVRFDGVVGRGSEASLRAPFSGAECQVLRYSIEERRFGPAVLPWDVTRHETAGSVPFRVRTADDAIDLLGPTRNVVLQRQVVQAVPIDEQPQDRVRRFEQDHGLQAATSRWRSPPAILRPLFRVLSLGTRRYVEARTDIGEDVTVLGRVTERGDAVDPIVIADRGPLSTALRMGRTSFVGVATGLGGILFGTVLFGLV